VEHQRHTETEGHAAALSPTQFQARFLRNLELLKLRLARRSHLFGLPPRQAQAAKLDFEFVQIK
jgi:hypothetical protein